MRTEDQNTDQEAIEEVIERQFGSLSWAPGETADWDTLMSDFLADAPLYPAIRPVKQQAISAFMERLSGLSETKLRSFREKVLGTKVRVFGNVAVALAGCETVENETETSRGGGDVAVGQGFWSVEDRRPSLGYGIRRIRGSS